MKDRKNIVSLEFESGQSLDFYDIAHVIYEGDYYAIMQPVILLEGMDRDEALVFKLDGPEEMTNFELVSDDDIIDSVFEIYLKLIKEEKKK